MEVISNRLGQIKVGTEITFRNLTMFPLLNGRGGQSDYLTLDEALAQGFAKMTEVSEGGSVPELKFVNDSDRPVFLLDGEELIGAKQNRILNLTILAAAKQSLVIPVSCVEQGRWGYQSAEFSSAPRTHYAAGRAMKMSQVTDSLVTRGERYSNQSAVWTDISAKTNRLRSSSPTQAMAAMYEQHSTNIEDYVRAFTSLEGQVGALFAINGKVIGFDLFDYAITLQKLLPKLVRSYALDAIDAQVDKSPTPSAANAQELLQAVTKAETKTFPATGKGEDVRLTGANLTGGGLIADGRLVHLSAFQLEENQTPSPSTTLSRASARRQHWRER
ncbi:MAG: DUF6569 family protein [Xenococcaceae cyanobacterium]